MKRKWKLLLSLMSVLLITTTLWMIQITQGYVPYVDQWTRSFVESAADTRVYDFFFFITQFGSREFLVPFVIVMAIVLGILLKNWIAPVIFAFGTLLSYEVNGILKDMIMRERPSILVEANAVGESFPSGHAMISIVCYGLLAYFLSRKTRSRKIANSINIFFSIVIFLIGISRYFINVHYLTDIVAGYFFGLLLLIFYIYFYEKVIAKSRKRVKLPQR